MPIYWLPIYWLPTYWLSPLFVIAEEEKAEKAEEKAKAEEEEPSAAAMQKKVYKAHKQKMKDLIPDFKIHNLDSDSSSEEEQTDA